MLAAVLKDFDKLVLEEVPAPEPRMQEVVVRVRACGFCATDYKAIKGMRRNVMFPFSAGHEPAGVGAKVGLGVSNVKEGDEVICQPSGYCGLCTHCRAGNTHYCEPAFTTGGEHHASFPAGGHPQSRRSRRGKQGGNGHRKHVGCAVHTILSIASWRKRGYKLRQMADVPRRIVPLIGTDEPCLREE